MAVEWEEGKRIRKRRLKMQLRCKSRRGVVMEVGAMR